MAIVRLEGTDLDFLKKKEEVVKQRKMIRVPTQYAKLQDGKYITVATDKYRPCVSRGCSVPSYVHVLGIPYCHLHSIIKLVEIIERLESGLEIDPDSNSV